MGQVLTLSEPALELMLYGSKTGIMNNYLQRQMQTIQPAFNEFSNRIYNTIQTSYNFINDKLTQYGLLNELHQNGVQALDNCYQELHSFTDLQNANFTMQRWVMAHPQVRQLYIDQNLDGYSNSYENVFGKNQGEQDYNYRRVMDGALESTDDHWVYKHYLEDILPGDKELDHYEKSIIRNTYGTIDHLLSTCNFDFTNPSPEHTKINR